MDTREKIVPVEQLAARLSSGEWLAVVGTFDPLTLSQAQRLAGLTAEGKSILAVVEPGTSCLLPVEARAVLVAALRSVNLVVIGDGGSLLELPHVKMTRDEEGERQRSLAFVEHVRRRQSR